MLRMAAPRLRFAPSPTGYLHIGGVRTALFNWLWARKHGGTFVLRIEDTDGDRSTPENEAIILRDMRWLGLDWDEGPEVGGGHGPYKQTERLEIYRDFTNKLVASGAAYRCYATRQELAKARAELKETNPKAQFRYPGWWRDRTDWPDDQPYVIRLRAPSAGRTEYHDLVFGKQSVPNRAQQDVVLVRSDGVPLYNFGCVVDDITMGISLIARGRDHMINTPLQVMLYRALGYPVPQFAHLPMMLGKNGHKLSKRHGAVAVSEYRDQGIPPNALLNYLARFGWSYGDQEVFSRADLIAKFDWERCNRADGRFDSEKLRAVSFAHLKDPQLIDDDTYVAGMLPLLRAKYGEVDKARVMAVLPLVRPRAKTFPEAVLAVSFLFSDELEMEEKAKKKFLNAEKGALLVPFTALLEGVAAAAFLAEPLHARVKQWVTEEGLKLGKVAQPARVALTGRTASPGLFEVMELLGKARTLSRLRAAIAIVKEA